MSKYSKENLQETVDKCMSVASVIKSYGLKPSGGNYDAFNRRFEEFEIDISHFTGKGWNRGNTPNFTHTKETFVRDVLCENGKGWGSSDIKKKLYEFELKKEICEECNQEPTWNNKPLVLHLDHINGKHRDNRLENLRILCPHCHSQTETYCGNKNK